eukprot:CAMPEP_0195530124 /NCGR_PEP_ID=MMETSP0794_2-20130614/32903_1 /TAXON_ID=515487 /ORGANISM="Stephanopyxis turris, Strain CCMP 815" /LENGTH=195 /DNA_ID=CAMNT_0040661553 /DNA_START=198 /DNA_END=785 /DNA_ORIENTATION=-
MESDGESVVSKDDKMQETVKAATKNAKTTVSLDGFEQIMKDPEIHQLTVDQVKAVSNFGKEQEIMGLESAQTKQVILKSIEYMEKLFDTDYSLWKSCKNENELCAFWAGFDECKKNPVFMLESCAPSCQQCDKNSAPPQFSSKYTTDTEEDRKNSNSPEGCIDGDSGCEEWAKMGECKKNPTYMLDNCKLSCDAC